MLRLCVGSIALRDLSGDSLPAMDIDINIVGHAVDGGDETLRHGEIAAGESSLN